MFGLLPFFLYVQGILLLKRQFLAEDTHRLNRVSAMFLNMPSLANMIEISEFVLEGDRVQVLRCFFSLPTLHAWIWEGSSTRRPKHSDHVRRAWVVLRDRHEEVAAKPTPESTLVHAHREEKKTSPRICLGNPTQKLCSPP